MALIKTLAAAMSFIFFMNGEYSSVIISQSDSIQVLISSETKTSAIAEHINNHSMVDVSSRYPMQVISMLAAICTRMCRSLIARINPLKACLKLLSQLFSWFMVEVDE
jgi:hypothetical protein